MYCTNWMIRFCAQHLCENPITKVTPDPTRSAKQPSNRLYQSWHNICRSIVSFAKKIGSKKNNRKEQNKETPTELFGEKKTTLEFQLHFVVSNQKMAESGVCVCVCVLVQWNFGGDGRHFYIRFYVAILEKSISLSIDESWLKSMNPAKSMLRLQATLFGNSIAMLCGFFRFK